MPTTGSSSADLAVLEHAADVLRRGGLVAYPTDTVYGLAALPSDPRAVERLFAAKGRPLERAVPLLLASAADVALVATGISEAAQRLMRACWPGALTIVLAKAPDFHSDAIGETVALRVPDHPTPRALARLLESAITGTSANVTGGPEPLTADDVRAQLGEAVGLIIDGGPCAGGRPSTVVDCTATPSRIVRAGAIDRVQLERAAGVQFE